MGPGESCYVIAEVGANHDRDLGKAFELVEVAASAGADAVKFQTYSGRSLYSTKTPRFDYLGDLADKPAHELLEEISLPRDWQPALAARCRERGIEFLSSPFDLQAVDELDALAVVAFKVASFEIVDLPFIKEMASRGRPLIVSTGMATIGEIDEALEAAHQGGCADVCLLQCASVYPAPPSALNIRAMGTMAAAFGVPVGLSDHSLGIHLATAAVAAGAQLIEKHVTLDRRSSGPDHPFAIEPEELHRMVAQIRDTEAAMGDGAKSGPSDAEREEMYSKARRSLVAAVDIPAGTRIEREMITIKRPGFGIKPRFIDAVVGRHAAVDIEADDILTWELL